MLMRAQACVTEQDPKPREGEKPPETHSRPSHSLHVRKLRSEWFRLKKTKTCDQSADIPAGRRSSNKATALRWEPWKRHPQHPRPVRQPEKPKPAAGCPGGPQMALPSPQTPTMGQQPPCRSNNCNRPSLTFPRGSVLPAGTKGYNSQQENFSAHTFYPAHSEQS